MSLRYKALPNQLYTKNRQKFTERLKPKSIAIFNSNDIYPISSDSTMPFQQHRDIFYLSGVDQEESILVLFPDARTIQNKEILFLRETNEHIAVWEGEKLTKEKAFEVSGVQTVYWLNDFEKVMYNLMTQAETVYLNINEHYRAGSEVETREDRFIKKLQLKYPLHNYERSNPILQRLRAVKEPEEIEQMKMACNITEQGFRAVLDFVKPGVWEYEIEAEYAYQFLKRGSRGFAYTPIVASGNNSNVLHYIQNSNQCKDGDLLLLDVGAEYGNYSSDLTRTIPVNGQYSNRQKQVYNAVLRVKNQAAKLITVGNNWYDYHEQVGELMTKELVDLNLISNQEVKENPKAYKKYFMHGTSHHIGLDTHDYGILSNDFQANMVFTVEPGIYIPQEGFGIRIEDNYVVQQSGEPINIMSTIPVEIEEIEALMNQNK